MTYSDLDRALSLKENIKTTSDAISVLESIEQDFSGRFSDTCKGDGFSWLQICEHRDGSGWHADLFRGEGNNELISVILEKLRDQLSAMAEEFEDL